MMHLDSMMAVAEGAAWAEVWANPTVANKPGSRTWLERAITKRVIRLVRSIYTKLRLHRDEKTWIPRAGLQSRRDSRVNATARRRMPVAVDTAFAGAPLTGGSARCASM